MKTNKTKIGALGALALLLGCMDGESATTESQTASTDGLAGAPVLPLMQDEADPEQAAEFQTRFDESRQELYDQWQEHRQTLQMFPDHPEWIAELAPKDGSVSLIEPVGGPTMAELREDVAHRYADLGAATTGDDGGPSGFGPMPTGILDSVNVCDAVRWMTQLGGSNNPQHGLRTYRYGGVGVGMHSLSQLQAGVEVAFDLFNGQSASFGWIGFGATTLVGVTGSVYGGMGVNRLTASSPAYKTGIIEAWNGLFATVELGLKPFIGGLSMIGWASFPDFYLLGAGLSLSAGTALPIPIFLPIEFGVSLEQYSYWNDLTEAQHKVFANVLGLPAVLVKDPDGWYIQFPVGGHPATRAVDLGVAMLAQMGSHSIPSVLQGLIVGLVQQFPSFANACAIPQNGPMPRFTRSEYFEWSGIETHGYASSPLLYFEQVSDPLARYEVQIGNADWSFEHTFSAGCIEPPDELCMTFDASHENYPSQSSGTWQWRVRTTNPEGPWSHPQTFTPLLGDEPGFYAPKPGLTLDFEKLASIYGLIPVSWLAQYPDAIPYVQFSDSEGRSIQWQPYIPDDDSDFLRTADRQFRVIELHSNLDDVPAGPVTIKFAFGPASCEDEWCTPITSGPTFSSEYTQE